MKRCHLASSVGVGLGAWGALFWGGVRCFSFKGVPFFFVIFLIKVRAFGSSW